MRILFTIALVLIANLGFSQIKRTIHTTFTADDLNSVLVEFNQDVEVEVWRGTRVLVETFISMEGANKSIIEHFISEGRYDITEDISAGCLKIDMDNFKDRIIVRNNEVVENVKLKIFVPEGLLINHPASSLSGL